MKQPTSQPGGAPLVSVIVLNYNGAGHLPDCLRSLAAQDYPWVEVIVADNGSTDGSRDVTATYPSVEFAALGHNYGFGKGNNLAASRARGKYLFFVNNDMRFASDAVSRLVAVAEADDSIFGLDIKQLSWDGARVIHSALHLRRTSDPRSPFAPFVGFAQEDRVAITPVPFANGANLFCARSKFEALGGFDATFFIDHEDQDLCWRAWMRGWKVLYVPEAICWHKVGQAGAGEISAHAWTPWKRKRFMSSATNRVRFIMKTQGAWWNLLTFLSAHVLAVCYLAALRPYHSWVMLLSFWMNVRRLGEILAQRRQAHTQNWYSSRDLLQMFTPN